MSEHNPLFIPDPEKRQDPNRCPACQGSDFSGRNVGGVITHKCNLCGNEWGGGLPQVPADSRTPSPPVRRPPAVGYEETFHKDHATGRTWTEEEEVLTPPSTVPDFRRGSLIPPEEDEGEYLS